MSRWSCCTFRLKFRNYDVLRHRPPRLKLIPPALAGVFLLRLGSAVAMPPLVHSREGVASASIGTLRVCSISTQPEKISFPLPSGRRSSALDIHQSLRREYNVIRSGNGAILRYRISELEFVSGDAYTVPNSHLTNNSKLLGGGVTHGWTRFGFGVGRCSVCRD